MKTSPVSRSGSALALACAIFALAGCGPTKTETPDAPGNTAPSRAEAAPPPATAAATAETPLPAGAREVDLEIDPEALTIDDAGGKVLYKPGTRVMAAHYKQYELDAAEFKAAVGAGNLTKRMKLRIAILSERSETSTPADPNQPSPQGGFTYQTFTCKVLKVLSVE